MNVEREECVCVKERVVGHTHTHLKELELNMQSFTFFYSNAFTLHRHKKNKNEPLPAITVHHITRVSRAEQLLHTLIRKGMRLG